MVYIIQYVYSVNPSLYSVHLQGWQGHGQGMEVVDF